MYLYAWELLVHVNQVILFLICIDLLKNYVVLKHVVTFGTIFMHAGGDGENIWLGI